MDNLTIRVNWRGPFSLEEVCETDLGGGLYLLTGKRPYERNEQIQYCGITEGFFRSRLKQHHKLPQIKKDGSSSIRVDPNTHNWPLGQH